MSSSRSTTSAPRVALVVADRQARLVHAHDDPRDAGRARPGDRRPQPVVVGGAPVVGPLAVPEVERRRDHHDPHEGVGLRLVDVPLAPVGADQPGQPVRQAAREPLDVAVLAVRLVVARDQLERVVGADPAGDEAAPGLLLAVGAVRQVAQREGEVVVAVGDRAQHGVGRVGRVDVAERREAHRGRRGRMPWGSVTSSPAVRSWWGRRSWGRGGRRRAGRGRDGPGIRPGAGAGGQERREAREHRCGRAPTGHARSIAPRGAAPAQARLTRSR